jgi:Holliday junction resolvase RusA-like endonuclease
MFLGGEMILRFSIPRAPVSTNQMYRRGKISGGAKGLYLSSSARDFKDCAAAYALVAARTASWPRPEACKVVRVEYTTWNTRHDADAVIKLGNDAFEGILYRKDSAVQEVTARKASDNGAVRVDVTIELL